MNKHVFIALALTAALVAGCKKDRKESDISITLNCGKPEYRQSHPKDCQGYNELFTPSKEETDVMKKLSE